MSKDIVSVDKLVKYYGKTKILNGVDLKVKESDFISIMGPSGSGKSTLLYAISGMNDFEEGSVNFVGHELHNLKEKKRMKIRLEDMGFVFQQMYMLQNLCLLDNIVLPGFILGRENKKIIIERAEQLMKRMEIYDVRDHLITEVSGGQLQRACICRALINNPKVLFADEPTGALNSKASNEVMKIFQSMNDDGTTVVFVSHDIKMSSYAKRVIYLVDGEIQGEYNFNESDADVVVREKKLKAWLEEKGW